MRLQDFHNLHAGQTCLIVGVGPNLELTPPELFDCPSFGVNTIYKRAGKWKPTYYVGVDERLKLEDGEAIASIYRDVPKFVPSPDWDNMAGDNFYRFKHFTDGSLLHPGMLANEAKALTDYGITYHRVMDAVFQIAWHMGFVRMLMIGVQHKPNQGNDEDRMHFWGMDTKAQADQPPTWWFEGYRTFSHMNGFTVLNISEDTYVPEDVLPRADWHQFVPRYRRDPHPLRYLEVRT